MRCGTIPPLSDFLQILAFSLSVTGPIFVLLALGILLIRIEFLNDAFVDIGSRLVFTLGLPALLFLNVSKANLGESADLALVGYGLLMTLVVYLLLKYLAAKHVSPAEDRGVVVQGAYRSNMGIIGLALCANAYGDQGLVAASLYVGLVTILFNVLAVITLSRSRLREQGWGRMLKGIVLNPLIIGIILAFPVSIGNIVLPTALLRSIQYVADLTLPLALICTGASLNLMAFRAEIRNTLLSSGFKLVVVPALFCLGGIALGFRGIELGVLLLMSSAPTAAASYVMVRAMGANAALAANIIAVTTIGSLVTTSLGIMLLRAAGLM